MTSSYRISSSSFLDNTMNKQPLFSGEFSVILKGFAIILMLFHHCCGFENWIIVPGIHFSERTHILSQNSNICVCIYAFLTAYAFCCHRDKSCLYSLTKIIKFLTSYWIVLCFIVLIIVILNGGHFEGQVFLKSLFPAHYAKLMAFAWYVVFYTMLMLALPYINLGEQISSLFQTCYSILLCILFSLFLKSLDLNGSSFIFSVLLGHLCAKFNIFNKLASCIYRKSTITRFFWGGVFFFIFYIGFSDSDFKKCIGPFWQSSIIPLILSLLLFYTFFRKIHLTAILFFIGKHSLNIWFLHCVFFSTLTRDIFQPMIYWCKNPTLIVLTTLLLCLIPSLLLTWIQNCTSNLIDRALLRHLSTPSEKA